LGVLGFLLSLASISWQIYVHHEAQTERVTVKLTMIHPVEPGEDESTAAKKKGGLLFDIVNIGQQPVYLKELILMTCGDKQPSEDESQCSHWFVYPTTFPNSESVRLEPGAGKGFWKADWDFSKNPIRDCCTEPNAPEYFIRVTSTRGVISQATAQVQIAYAHMEEKHGRKTNASHK
jgi:hypothetical protein